MPHAKIDGLRLWYETLGEGEPMVLVGGSGLGRQNMDPIIPFLEDHFTLLSFDQRGYGESDSAGLEAATAETFADDAVALMDALGWERAHVHGTSFGGMIALAMAVRHPDRILSAIPNGFFAKPDGARKLMLEAWHDHSGAAGMSRGFAAHVATQTFHPDYLDEHPEAVDEVATMLRRVPLPTWHAAIRAMMALDLSEGLPTCPVPTLVLAGEIDTITPLDMSPSGIGMRKTYELMPNAEIVIFEGIGHGTPFEVPEEHAGAIVRFVEALAQKG